MELKPCPFCGGEAEAYSDYSCVHERIAGLVKCKGCGAEVWGGKTFNTYMMDTTIADIAKLVESIHKEAKESAIEAWNRRYGDA